jgi:hypothetical protein
MSSLLSISCIACCLSIIIEPDHAKARHATTTTTTTTTVLSSLLFPDDLMMTMATSQAMTQWLVVVLSTS